jgi:hypothetical protein
MKRNLVALCIIAAAPGAALAERPGDHPAVTVKSLYAAAGYDYASKFYPHPAWLYLLPEAPRPAIDHPSHLLASSGKQGLRVPAEPVAPPSR